jgi:predicted ABC-type ATPase
VIARSLSAADPDSAAIAAGRVMLMRLRRLAEQRVSFAFETTLAPRMFAPWLRDLRASGYAVHFFFLWLPSADFAVERVADRVRAGAQCSSSDRPSALRGWPAELLQFVRTAGLDVESP